MKNSKTGQSHIYTPKNMASTEQDLGFQIFMYNLKNYRPSSISEINHYSTKAIFLYLIHNYRPRYHRTMNVYKTDVEVSKKIIICNPCKCGKKSYRYSNIQKCVVSNTQQSLDQVWFRHGCFRLRGRPFSPGDVCVAIEAEGFFGRFLAGAGEGFLNSVRKKKRLQNQVISKAGVRSLVFTSKTTKFFKFSDMQQINYENYGNGYHFFQDRIKTKHLFIASRKPRSADLVLYR